MTVIQGLDAAAVIGLAALALLLTLKTGLRGFYPFDQSIVFDGSYRVLSGQIPYRDFVMPFGPVTFWLHAGFFRLLGVTYFAYVFGAAVINVLAVLAALTLVRLLFPGRRLVSYVAGLVTAVWFYPPFGTPWVDQTAFFFSLLATTALVAAVVAEPRRGWVRDGFVAASGVLAALAFLSKQNAGAFMLPLYPMVVLAAWLPDRRLVVRGLAGFAAGLGATAAGFALWLWAASDPAIFWRYVITLALQLGEGRIGDFLRTGFGTLGTFFGGRGPTVIRLISIASLAVGLAVLATALATRRRAAVPRRIVVAGLLCVYAVSFQHIFIRTTLNQPENGLGFVGIIFALAVGLALEVVVPAVSKGRAASGSRVTRATALVAGVWVVTVAAVAAATATGIRVGLTRKVQDVFVNPAFAAPFKVEGLSGLRWGEPTRMGDRAIEGRDVASLLAYLRERGLHFFIFPDFTIMYGLAGVPSPQPLLWFHEGVTYPKGSHDAALDRWIVAALKRSDVRIVVIEQVAWFNTGKRLDAFPEMKAYIYGSFARLGQIGTFSIYEKAPG